LLIGARTGDLGCESLIDGRRSEERTTRVAIDVQPALAQALGGVGL